MRQLTKTRNEAHLNENTNDNNTCVFLKKSHRKYKNSMSTLTILYHYLQSD